MKKPRSQRSFDIVALLGAVLITVFSGGPVAAALPPIRHVFIIILENEGSSLTFGKHSPAPYLAHTLRDQGAYLPRYYGIGHASLDNYIALISGQSANVETQNDCQTFSDFNGKYDPVSGQAIGRGCVYPANVPTLPIQLEAAGFTWKAYSEDMGSDPARESPTCGHPQIGQPDPTQRAQTAANSRPQDQYAARHNPFVYFHSIIDTSRCDTRVVNLDALPADLSSAETTPNFVFITPNLCNDGHDGGRPGKTCVNGEPGGLISADRFLQKWIPRLTSSAAFQNDGLIVVTFDEAEIEGHYVPATKSYRLSTGDASSCCHEPVGPNISSDQMVFGSPDEGPGIFGPGGGRIGAVLLSPFIRAKTVSHVAYNHYSLLKTFEKLFALAPIGFAAQPGLRSLGPDVFTNAKVK